MECKNYHDKWIEVMEKWINTEEGRVKGKHYILALKKEGVIELPKATITIGVWTVKDEVMRLMIELRWFYLYPYSLTGEERRIEVLRDEVYYVILGDVIKVVECSSLGKILRKDEVKIDNPDSIFHLLDEISKSFSDEARNDLKRIIEKLKNYESYSEY